MENRTTFDITPIVRWYKLWQFMVNIVFLVLLSVVSNGPAQGHFDFVCSFVPKIELLNQIA
jgi:hypothetical protein